jgi:uncharacterized protein YndB with AHSA1/START domain
MAERTVIDITIDAPVVRVWRALREPAEIRRWFGWDHDGLDDEIDLIFVRGARADDEAHVLDTGDGRFELTEGRDLETRVRLVREAPPSGDPDPVDAGWITFTQQLRFALEREPGENREARRVDAPDPLPDGELWFKDPHHVGIVLADGEELLVVEGGKAILSRYGG